MVEIPTPTVSLNTYLINTFFTVQAPEGDWRLPWQDACEEASLLITSYYFNDQHPTESQVKDDILAMVSYETKQGWGIDVDIAKMQKIATNYLKLKSTIRTNPTIAELKAELLQGHPVIIPASGKTLFSGNTHFNNFGPDYHNVVLLGYDDTRKQFIVHDVGTRFGANYRYDYKLLMDSIHDLPKNGNVKDILQGPKKVLAIEKLL